MKNNHKKVVRRILSISALFIFFFMFFSNTFIYAAEDSLNINSKACILIEPSTGEILYEKNAYTRLYPASTTKVMTAILVMENVNLKDTCTVSQNAVSSIPITYSSAKLQVGEKFTVEQLLNLLMIPSANDAAVVLAEYIGGSVDGFSVMMNQKAKEIGCLDTNFVNPNGIHNENHYTTAYDLSLIGKYATKFPELVKICQTLEYEIPPSAQLPEESRKFGNTNALIRPSTEKTKNKYYYSYASGLKTGHTNPAQYCMIATAKKEDMELLVVTLNAPKTDAGDFLREYDCITLFDYGFSKYRFTNVKTQNDLVEMVTIPNGTKETKHLNVLVSQDIKTLVKNDTLVEVDPVITYSSTLQAPISEGEVLGEVSYTISGKTYTSSLVAQSDVIVSEDINLAVKIVFVFFIVLLVSSIAYVVFKEKK